MGIKLYGGARSPNVRKVRLLAAELGLELEAVPMDFTKGDYRTPEYLAKNPNGKVPTIDDGGFVLWESAAILRYLASKRPERGLVPSDPRGAAKLDAWMFWWTAHPESALLLLVVEKLVKPFLKKETSPAIVGAAEADVGRYLPVLDAELAGKEFILGGLTVVDFQAAPWVEAAAGFGVDLAQHPNLSTWLSRMQARPCWRATAPS